MIIRATTYGSFGKSEANVLGIAKWGLLVGKHVIGSDLLASTLWSVYDLDSGYAVNSKPFRSVKYANAFRKEVAFEFGEFNFLPRQANGLPELTHEQIRLISTIEAVIHDNE